QGKSRGPAHKRHYQPIPTGRHGLRMSCAVRRKRLVQLKISFQVAPVRCGLGNRRLTFEVTTCLCTPRLVVSPWITSIDIITVIGTTAIDAQYPVGTQILVLEGRSAATAAPR